MHLDLTSWTWSKQLLYVAWNLSTQQVLVQLGAYAPQGAMTKQHTISHFCSVLHRGKGAHIFVSFLPQSPVEWKRGNFGQGGWEVEVNKSGDAASIKWEEKFAKWKQFPITALNIFSITGHFISEFEHVQVYLIKTNNLESNNNHGLITIILYINLSPFCLSLSPENSLIRWFLIVILLFPFLLLLNLLENH